MSATPDSTLANPEQSIADLQRELAKCKAELAEREAELAEAREQQTATAEVLEVINSSPGDLTPVFDAMLDKAIRLCDTAFGIMQTYDGEAFPTVAMRGAPPALVEVFRERELFKPTRGNLAERIVAGETVIRATDLREEPHYLAGARPARALVELGAARSFACIALRKDNALLGALTTYRTEIRPFSDKQIALLQNFASQAVIAMENAPLLTETREALEQQTATAEVLQVINSSPGDLAPVFDAMLEKAMRLCEAAFGVLWTLDGDAYRATALRGVPPEFAEFVVSQPRRPEPDTALGQLASGESFVHVADITGRHTTSEIARKLVELGNIRTLLAVPLLKDGDMIGAINVYRQEVRPFTDKQIALLQNFAAQAVIAMENARLLTETREALDQQTATAEVLQVINSSPGDLTPVFDAILEKAHVLCGARHGYLLVREAEGFRLAAAHAETPFANYWRQQGSFRPPEGSVLERILRGERTVHLADAMAYDGYRGTPMGQSIVQSGVRTLLLLSLRRDDELLGVLTAYRQEVRPFSEKQIAVLENFAAQAVIAMENARLITETREALEQQTATAEVLGVINSSPGNLAPVFDAMLEKATRICEGAFGVLLAWDGERFHRVAFRGVPAELIELLQQPLTPVRGSFADRLVRGESVISTPDLRETEYVSGPGREAFLRHGARSCAHVALRKEEKLLGVITLYRQEVRPFSDKQIALLQNFAAQAVIAMENARLISETREALEQQTATAEVLRVINSSPGDLAPVFDAMLYKALHLCGAAFGTLHTYDGEYIQTVAHHGLSPTYAEFIAATPHRARRGPIASFLHGAPFVHFDAAESDLYREGHPLPRRLVDIEGARTLLAVPLRKDLALLGMIVIYRREVLPFSEKQIALLQNFAAQAVIAMENARLIGELHQRTDQIAELNRGLEARVAEQVEELGRVGRLKRFLAPQLAELIVSQGDEKILESHRRDIVVVFCDLRGYTSFTETAEPEEVLDFLREYHGALGPLVSQHEGTLDQFSGDGIMVFFNDPVPCPDPAERAVKMAMAMREEASKLIAGWRERGRDLGFGAGIAQGYATLGQIGFSERSGYTAIGTVCNVAARLCAEAKDGQILLSQRANLALMGSVATEQLGPLALKGLTQPVVAYNVPLVPIQPALRVIEGGPQNV